MNQRIFVEKKVLFQTTAQSLLEDLIKTLKIKELNSLRLIQIYDVLNVDEEVLNKAKKTLFSEIVTDDLYIDFDYKNDNYFCIEALPGQFDQRADSAKRGLMLLGSKNNVEVKSAILYIINKEVSNNDKNRIINYLINPLENHLKDLSLPLDTKINISIKEVQIINDFIDFNEDKIKAFKKENNLAMSLEDLYFIQSYFIKEKRNPSITEILVLDTYWSDHCRHTTFETKINTITIENEALKEQIEEAIKTYEYLRKETDRLNKPKTLMDMASIEAKYQKQKGSLDDMEISDEVNACSIEVDVDVDDKTEKYLVMYKNETHNHPTEIEPFGGAATCIGGAIRDPLSGRAYVYQAMRISGAANVLEDIDKTIKGKLSQKMIAQKAAAGYSSYGNQIGLATGQVVELYHEGYKAKRMELGAVVGAVKKEDVLRAKPSVGDYVVLLGAPTGRDGVGGATGSSKVHDVNVVEEAKSEVQKGNAPEERKLQRLFRNPKLTKLIKKANDLGAGGVSVAIGEIADGVKIDLNALPIKYAGLNGTDLALSESQERMVIVIDSKDYDKVLNYAYKENVEAIKVAVVTNDRKLEMIWNNQKIVDLKRDFLDTNGVRQEINPIIENSNHKTIFDAKRNITNNSFKDSLEKMVSTLNYASQQALDSIFDNTVGKTTVLASYGGKYKASPSEVSAQKIPVMNARTNTTSVLAFGGNPYIGEYQPFYVGSYAIIEAVSKLVASGVDYKKARLSLQEYFESVSGDDCKFGKPVAALLGALHTMHELGLPALGGKDSMSGTFEDITVPPTVIAFAIACEKNYNLISTEFKEANNYVYALITNEEEKIAYDKLIDNYNLINNLQRKGLINACSSIKDGGIAHVLANMAYGNNIGINIEDISLETLFYPYYGGFVFASQNPIENDKLIYLGQTVNDKITYRKEVIEIKDLLTKAQSVLENIYPTTFRHKDDQISKTFCFDKLKIDKDKIKKNNKVIYSRERVENPLVYIPAFMGTNCEYDVQKTFEAIGFKTLLIPFVDLDEQAIEKSIDAMVDALDKAHVFAIPGGFSAGDEPDGSGKYIVNILLNDKVKAAINRFIEREGLIIGICNGFQALIKSGLLPYGKIGELSEKMPTLFLNQRGKHIADFVNTKIINNNSPWLSKIDNSKLYTVALSHGEGRFVADYDVLKELFENNQIISQYTDYDGNITMDYRYNPNGSFASIEGMTSPDGRILGKMGHAERYEDGNYINIVGEKELLLFESALAYFRKEND